MAQFELTQRAYRPTLTQVFAFSFLTLIALLACLVFYVLNASRQSIVESSERLREEASRQITTQVRGYLQQADRAVDQLEQGFRLGVVDCESAIATERALFSLLIANPDLTEATLTTGRLDGYDGKGKAVLSPEGRARITTLRRSGAILTQWVHAEEGKFVQESRVRPEGGAFLSAPLVRDSGVEPRDPTLHMTFKTPASHDFKLRTLWSDLHYSDLDSDLPAKERSARVSAQKAIFDAGGKFIGVVRVGLSAAQIDRIAQLKLIEHEAADPHRVMLVDNQGRLITRLAAEDALEESDGDLRVKPGRLPREIALLLTQPQLEQISAEQPTASGQFSDGQQDYLYTLRSLGGTQDWIVGVVAPLSFYLGRLAEVRRHLILVSSAIVAAIILGGSLLLGSVRRAQARIVMETSKMNRFEFAPTSYSSAFRDINESLDGIERAKRAMRAMGKYVPIDLVRKLYQAKSEPMLGGETIEVSIMFTDIEGFTTLAETLDSNVLAQALGRYLDVMVRCIQIEHGGTIDKFIGDAIMALWNAPTPMADHASHACEAALASREATALLFASEEWQGLPPFRTRFGLHREQVMVGHFGARDRMNYTAIGDGVNLASRLEGLNKYYGTFVIVSRSIRDAAQERFDFRLLDCVAVKGKRRGIEVYELLGAAGTAFAPKHRAYETAFEHYRARRFDLALSALEPYLAEDEPSRVLAGRCREYFDDAPTSDWTGVYELHQK